MIIKFFKHLKTVLKHKFYVGYYCFLFGIPIQGILHDLSKFSPVEFFESVKYYDRIPMSSRIRQNDGISYSDLGFYNAVFQNGDKIILQGELDV